MDSWQSVGGAAPPFTLRDALNTLTATNQDLVLLDYSNVIIRKDYHNFKTVRLLSGGIAGPDLPHALLVGKGMLTASILGENSVPGSRQILRTIRELNEGENCGVFVLVQSNSDVFNFGLAVERADLDCRTRVKMLLVNDRQVSKEERYSCGFVLLAKVLGAMAEQGGTFDDIHKCYKGLSENIVTVPLNFTEVKKSGSHSITFMSKDLEPDIIDEKCQVFLNLHPAVPTAVLINISKAVEQMAELALVKMVIEKLQKFEISLVRVYYGNFIKTVHSTATLTVMKLQDLKLLQYLDAPCGAPGWRHFTQFLPQISIRNEIPGLLKHLGKQPVKMKGPKLGGAQVRVLEKSLSFACDALISCERQLNVIDAERSDGKVGSRFRLLCENLKKRLHSKTLPLECPHAFLKKLGVITESALGGVMGSLYGIFFESGANYFGDLPENEFISSGLWGQALLVACDALDNYIDQGKKSSTMYYPLKACEMAVNRELAIKEDSFVHCFGAGVSSAEEAAQNTRAPEGKYPDAGAHAVGIWARAVFEGVKLMNAQSGGNDM